jgi:hypothetical protein
MLARAVGATDSRPSTSGGGGGRAVCRAYPARVRESEGATARADCRTSGIRLHGGLHACWRAWCLTVRHAQGQPHELSTTSHLSGPPQRRPGPARAPLLAAAHLRPSRHFCSQWSLLKCNRDRNQTIRNHAVYVCLSLSRKCGNPRQIPYISRAFRVTSAQTSPSSLKRRHATGYTLCVEAPGWESCAGKQPGRHTKARLPAPNASSAAEQKTPVAEPLKPTQSLTQRVFGT